MEYKAWKFEDQWYVVTNNAFPLHMNTEAACIEFARLAARVEHLEDAIDSLTMQTRHKRQPKRILEENQDGKNHRE